VGFANNQEMESRLAGWWNQVHNRLPRSRYLALHLIAGWVLSLGLLCLFLAISQLIGPGSRVARWDDEVARACRDHREASPSLRRFFLIVTDAGSIRTLTLVVVGLSTILALLHRRLLLLIFLLGPMAGGIIDSELKNWFERSRPPMFEAAVHECSMSFPSGHSLGSLVTYGLAT
jgi:hypothetical protein